MSRALQKVKIEVNESGTVASSSTGESGSGVLSLSPGLPGGAHIWDDSRGSALPASPLCAEGSTLTPPVSLSLEGGPTRPGSPAPHSMAPEVPSR